jgi:hypothetical protein
MSTSPFWDQLSDELLHVFAWAHAVELGDDVGTRAVLIGIIRAGEGESDPDQLLRAAGISSDQLFTALQEVAPSWQIEPYVPMLKPTSRPPVLTPNVVRALQIAEAKRPRRERDMPLKPSHVFGALLEVRDSTAYRGLARVLGSRISLERVAVDHDNYLNVPNGLSFYDLLRKWIDEQPHSSATEASTSAADHASTTESSASTADDASTKDASTSAADHPPTTHLVEWLTDSRASEDLLGREHLASALAKRLDRMNLMAPNESFLLHLDGPWGAGKSSVLYFLRQQLDQRWLVIDFDAWRQSRVGPPWWALLTSLRKGLRQELGWQRGTWLRVRETVARIRRDHGIAPFVVLMLAAIVAYLFVAPGASEIRAWLALTTAVVTGCVLLLGPGRGAIAFLMWDSAMGAKRYEQWHKDPMEGLAEHFAWLVARTLRPIVFFIDDLDRADERYVVDLLDSIQTLVRNPAGERPGTRAPCFVVAADGRWIRRSYEDTYAGFTDTVGEPGRPLGYLFLDKIFQLTVDVPAIGSEQQLPYLRRLLGGEDGIGKRDGYMPALERVAQSNSQREILAAVNHATPQERAGATAAALEKLSDPDVELTTEHELQKFAPLIERNPRSMKRFINAYSMALSTMLLEGRDIDPDLLALWTLLRLRWPDLADFLRLHPDVTDTLATDKDQAAVALPEGMAELAHTPEVHNVMAFAGGLLTSEAVRKLTGVGSLS